MVQSGRCSPCEHESLNFGFQNPWKARHSSELQLSQSCYSMIEARDRRLPRSLQPAGPANSVVNTRPSLKQGVVWHLHTHTQEHAHTHIYIYIHCIDRQTDDRHRKRESQWMLVIPVWGGKDRGFQEFTGHLVRDSHFQVH